MRKRTYAILCISVVALLFAAFFYFLTVYAPQHLISPRIVSFHPENGAVNVPLNTTITVSFSKPMDEPSVESAFNIYPNVEGEFLWNGEVLTFRPRENFQENTTYTVTISTDAKDRWGNNLESSLQFSFATGRWMIIRVTEPTSDAVQKALDTVAASETNHRVVILPTATYTFTSTVTVPENTVVQGEGKLRNVCVPELEGDEEPPYWDPPTAHCVTTDSSLIMFQVTGDNVTFRNLRIEGAVKSHESGSGTGIYIYNCRNVTIEGCELFYHRMAVWFAESQGLVVNCYIHRNYRNGYGYGVCIVGTSMTTGGSQVTVLKCEFALNRHDIASNSPETVWELRNCYFRDNDPVQKQCAVDSHPHGGRTLKFAILNCTFKNTRPIYLSSGSGVIKYNFFHSSCKDWSREVILLGRPVHNGRYVPNPKPDVGKPKLHDIRIEGNINETGNPLLFIYRYDFPDDDQGPKPVAENVWVDGELVEESSPYIQK